MSQAKSSAGYYQQLAQETATSLDEVKQSLAAAEEALKEAREELKAAAAQRARQRGQLSVLKEDEVAAVSAGQGSPAAAAELAALQQQKQQLTQQVEQLQLKLAQVQVSPAL